LITYTCQKCGAPLESPDSAEGTKDTCPACGATHRVPFIPISYKCASCGARLESPGEFAGRWDDCPKCGFQCPVPKSKRQLAEERELRKRAEDERRKEKEAARLEAQRKADAQREAVETERERITAEAVDEPGPPSPNQQSSSSRSMESRDVQFATAIVAGAFVLAIVLICSGAFTSTSSSSDYSPVSPSAIDLGNGYEVPLSKFNDYAREHNMTKEEAIQSFRTAIELHNAEQEIKNNPQKYGLR
jgi:DNA-directed RNA polymerase subunit RPC12/RpoP